jgi:hypothetical protein
MLIYCRWIVISILSHISTNISISITWCIYHFWLPLWYLQIFLVSFLKKNVPLELYNFKLFINNDNFIICFTVLNLENVWQASSLFNLMTSTVFKCCQTYYFIALIPTKLKTLKCCLSNTALSTCTHNCIVQAFLRRGVGGVHYFWRIISVFMVYQFMYRLVLYYNNIFYIGYEGHSTKVLMVYQ